MWEREYLDALSRVAQEGHHVMDRTGVGTRWLHGVQLRIPLTDGRVPLPQTKRVDPMVATAELLWIIRGATNVNDGLGSHIWDEWADSDGNLGPIYGAQWRSWCGYDGARHDQLASVIESLRRDPHSRRHVVSSWAVHDLEGMALPPCHTLFQFNTGGDRSLYTSLYMRSGDMFLGVPFNLLEYSILTHMVGELTSLAPTELSVYIANAHVYDNHMDAVTEQLSRRIPSIEARVRITPRERHKIEDFCGEDFDFPDYHPQPRIKAPVAV